MRLETAAQKQKKLKEKEFFVQRGPDHEKFEIFMQGIETL